MDDVRILRTDLGIATKRVKELEWELSQALEANDNQDEVRAEWRALERDYQVDIAQLKAKLQAE